MKSDNIVIIHSVSRVAVRLKRRQIVLRLITKHSVNTECPIFIGILHYLASRPLSIIHCVHTFYFLQVWR